MEKDYCHKSIEKKWRLSPTHPDQSIYSPNLTRQLTFLLKDIPIDFTYLVDLNRADAIHLKNRMQNREDFPDQEEITIPNLSVRSHSPNKRFLMEPRKYLEDFGWDTFKFALSLKANPDSGKSAFLNRIKRSKSFTHKVWNAARYVNMNLRGDEDSTIDIHKASTVDKWFLHQLNCTVDQINEFLDHGHMTDMARVLYQFFRHEFCDWYLEFSKADIQNSETRKTLKLSLQILLQCLHPFIPFLTEEIHGKMNPNGKLLMDYPFPQFDSKLAFLREHAIIEHLKALISKSRQIKSENSLPSGTRSLIYITINAPGRKNDIKSNLKYYEFLIPGGKAVIVKDFSGLPGGFRAEIQNMKIMLSLENETDRKSYVEKLERDFKQTGIRISSLESKLSDPRFVKQKSESDLTVLKRSLLKSHKIKEKIQKAISDFS
jgi:valyl-tRNA synthetase